jgi:HTH-type transcriptional regulator/antitoxin HigA
VQAINEIVEAKNGITPETAIAFAEALGASPGFWLNLESAYRIDLL